MIKTKPRIKIVATILAKNEEDIIGQTIEHTIEQGVSCIIFTDNDSTDKTKEIASSYPEIVEIIEEPGNDHNQSKWVTKMAQLAYKLNPDWIVHLDADELWCGLQNLRNFNTPVVRCEKMYLHPPVNKFSVEKQRYYLDFDHINVPQECKIAHKPIKNIVVTHGNHGILGSNPFVSTKEIYRHHYPIRSYRQWEQKSLGHKALERRGVCCKRWEKWHNLFSESAWDTWNHIIESWNRIVENNVVNHEDLMYLMSIWSDEETKYLFKTNPNMIPRIGEWPKINHLLKSAT